MHYIIHNMYLYMCIIVILFYFKLHFKKYLFCDIVILDKKNSKGEKKRKITFTNIYYISIPLFLGYSDI